MRASCFLVEHGVPFDVAFGMGDTMRLAFQVVFGEISGPERFDWETMCWVEQK